jgi:SAM-dependent methyltransferase
MVACMAKRRPIRWPKQPPPLSPDQEAAREAFMLAWHERLPTKYAIVERFNHGALARLPPGRERWRTLEIGAGIGGHLAFEDLAHQEYHCLELREEFCTVLRTLPGVAGVHAADIQGRTPFEAGSFDRVVAIHVLEHLRDLPRAVEEVSRILADDGIFDVVLPCEGGAAYYLARRISAKPFFERRFGMSYDPIIASEHVNTLDEVLETLEPRFVAQSVAHFPLGIPLNTINLAVALRMKKRAKG